MGFSRDRQIQWYCAFLLLFSTLLLSSNILLSTNQLNAAKMICITQNEAIASSLLAQGVSREKIINAFINNEISIEGKELLQMLGIDKQNLFLDNHNLSQFQQLTYSYATCISVVLVLILLIGTFYFFRKRRALYLQADTVITKYINGDYSCHLPQNQDGAIFQLFSKIEELATMLQSKSEIEHKSKDFLKSTISDISHQLKTPLAALIMYQEIIAAEPDNVATVTSFSAKIGISLARMERLIQSMLKITRLDTGNIIFEKECILVYELVSYSITDLITRSQNEGKHIFIDGSPNEQIVCDLEWTGEAIGNLVKNALDHTDSGGIIHITWERTPTMLRIFVIDNGNGIAPEDIHHIFKRFYRSKKTLKTPGIGLGLSLAKSIVEGQGGFITVQSELNQGTTFTLSFLTEL